MKRLFIILTIAAFAFSAVTVMAEGLEKAKKIETKISCCSKGDCKEMTRTECAKAKGQVVANCSKCKPLKSGK